MKSCYVLTVETNLVEPSKKNGEQVYKRNVKVFEDFDTAKTGMRSLIKEFATTKNELFDGNGNVLGFEEDFECAIEEAEEFEESEVVLETLRSTPQILRKYFLGDEITFSDEFYEEFDTAEFEVSEDLTGWCKLNIESFDIPFRLIDISTPPFMQINSFIMDNPEKVYVFRIRSACEEWEQPSFIQLELRKVEIE